jgi:signal transduction histidine kinase
MSKTLYGKLAAVLLVMFAGLGVLYVFLTLYTTRLHIREVSQRLHHALARNFVKENLLIQDGGINEAALKETFHVLMVINPSIECYLLSPEGQILAYSAPPGTVKRQSVSLEPIHRFLVEEPTLPILGDDPRDSERQKVFSVSPIPIPEVPSPAIRETAALDTAPQLEGYLYIVLGGQEYDSAAAMLRGSYIFRLSTGLVIGGLAGALLGGLFLFNVITRRVQRLAASMDRFKSGDYVEPPDLSEWRDKSEGDEIDQLAASFEQLAERISEQMQELEAKDQLRRVLVANVSHDLRTPLATLHGYLETLLLKDAQLEPEERRRYVEIATRHSERLGKLISELFELSKLDSRETEVHPEAFSLAELVQDVTQEFQLVAREKEIELNVQFESQLPFVWADIRLLERAVENLVENALRHTPSGGSVTVSLQKENDLVRMDVTDTGCGIPGEALGHIFDRFYRVRSNGTHNTEGAGLGLAITKRILELHESDIEVMSQVEQGTTFTFRLPTTTPKK